MVGLLARPSDRHQHHRRQRAREEGREATHDIHRVAALHPGEGVPEGQLPEQDQAGAVVRAFEHHSQEDKRLVSKSTPEGEKQEEAARQESARGRQGRGGSTVSGLRELLRLLRPELLPESALLSVAAAELPGVREPAVRSALLRDLSEGPGHHTVGPERRGAAHRRSDSSVVKFSCCYRLENYE